MSMDAFLRQFHATGRSKGEGYGPSEFADLDPEERARARAMLLESALAGDTVDLNGLGLVGDAGAVAALRGAIAPNWDWDIDRIGVLFDLTGDADDLRGLTRYLDSADSAQQARAANRLSGAELPAALEPFLADRIASRRHHSALLGLLHAWLRLRTGRRDFGVFQEHIELVRKISSAPAERRRQMLTEAVATLGARGGG